LKLPNWNLRSHQNSIFETFLIGTLDPFVEINAVARAILRRMEKTLAEI
jgi:hypothetical protein